MNLQQIALGVLCQISHREIACLFELNFLPENGTKTRSHGLQDMPNAQQQFPVTELISQMIQSIVGKFEKSVFDVSMMFFVKKVIGKTV